MPKTKTALVTGGSHGIGLAICKQLSRDGFDIAFCARGKRYSIELAADEIRDCGTRCFSYTAEVLSPAFSESVVDDVIEKFGRIDVLVNNVGGGSSWGNMDAWEDTLSTTWERVIQQTFLSTVQFTNSVIPHMVAQEWGRVISIASIYGKEAGGTAWYQSMKSAQISFMKSYSAHRPFVQHGITFNTICPGYIDMPDKPMPDAERPNIPVGFAGSPEDIAPVVSMLCGEKSRYINGSCIVIDGGYTKSF